jgi:hypothetical protein
MFLRRSIPFIMFPQSDCHVASQLEVVWSYDYTAISEYNY